MPMAGLTFLFLFLPAALLLPAMLPEGLRRPALLVCSLVFYARRVRLPSLQAAVCRAVR